MYADLYASNVWAAAETPKGSGKFIAESIPFSCAQDSPLKCDAVPNSPLPALGYIFSFGEDNNNDVYILTSTGVYRVVPPSRCNFTCSKEDKTDNTVPKSSPSASNGYRIAKLFNFLYLCLMLVAFML